MKKIVLLLLLLFTITILSGCTKEGELNNVDNISVKDIFKQKEDNYYIYFHRIDCQDCENTNPTVIQYAQVVDTADNCSAKRKIYAVLLFTESEKPGLSTYIYREYTGEGGQGTDGKYFVNGVKNWEDLYIASTASLIAISTNANGEKIATYVTQGSQNVIDKLMSHLNGCYQ